MRKKLLVGLTVATILGLAISLGWSLSRPDEAPITVTGQVRQDNRHGGTLGCLDEWDYPVTQCRVILRYAGAEGFAEIEGQRSPWNVYVSNGKIIDQVQVNEDGVYSFKLDWQPEGVFTGDTTQEVTAVFYQIELLVPVEGFYDQKVIGPSRIKITENTEAAQGPIFLLSSLC